MRKPSLLKLGFAALIALSSLLAVKPAQADLCVFRYTLPNGHVCTFSHVANGCCHYTGDSAATVCPPICGP